MLARDEKIPSGWRLASIQDVNKHEKEAHAALRLKWGIYRLSDGKMHGSGNKYKIEKSIEIGLGHKLVINKGPG